MANLDTRNKRMSALGVNMPFPRLQQNPAGVIQHSGRHIAGYIYSGIHIHQVNPTISNSNCTARFLDKTELRSILG